MSADGRAGNDYIFIGIKQILMEDLSIIISIIYCISCLFISLQATRQLVANLFICLQSLHIHIIKHWNMIIHIVIYYHIFFARIITIQSSCVLFNYTTE